MTRSCLALLGYTIMETGKARSKTRCKRCGTEAYATGWQGNTPGLADLYVHSSWWKVPIGLAIEMKTSTGAVRDAQASLARQGMTVICRNLTDVLDVLISTETLLGNPEQVERIEKFKNANTTILAN